MRSSLVFLRRAVVLAWLCVFMAPAFAEGTLLVFGDSLAAAYNLAPQQGWVNLLAERVVRLGLPWKVVNASVSGETTAGGLRRLPEDLKRHKPQAVMIELGANDALRGQPVAGIRDNLDRMIRLAKQAKAEPVLVAIMIPPNYGIDYATEFREMYPALARKHGIVLVPFLLAGLVDRAENFQADNLHPTAKAQPLVLDAVWPSIEPLLRKRNP